MQHGVGDLFGDQFFGASHVVARVDHRNHLQLIGSAFQRRARNDHRVVNLILRDVVVRRRPVTNRIPTRLVGLELLRDRIVRCQRLLASLLRERIDRLLIAAVAQRRRLGAGLP